MKVSELIEQLLECDPDALVFSRGDHGWIYNCYGASETYLQPEDDRGYAFDEIAPEDVTTDPNDDDIDYGNKWYSGDLVYGVLV